MVLGHPVERPTGCVTGGRPLFDCFVLWTPSQWRGAANQRPSMDERQGAERNERPVVRLTSPRRFVRVRPAHPGHLSGQPARMAGFGASFGANLELRGGS